MAGRGSTKTGKKQSRKKALTTTELTIREIPSKLPEKDQFFGLLIRTRNERVFFFPSRMLLTYELRPDDLDMGALQKVLNDLSKTERNLGVENAVLVNTAGEYGSAGMRIVEIIRGGEKAIGPVTELLPAPVTGSDDKGKPKKMKSSTK